MPADNPKLPFYDGTYQPTVAEQAMYHIQPYLPAPELVEAVQLAIHLGRPLLLRGEPGSGKSRLAQAVAYEFGRRYPDVERDPGYDFPWPYEFWPVKSTSRAKDGLYQYDAVGRLRDANLAAAQRLSGDEQAAAEARRKFESVRHYIRFGPLGRAFQNKLPTVVLIDEIDKADIDFPNDLLIELDEQRFRVEEWDEELDAAEGGALNRVEWITAQAKPIILITSNAEKELPDAFLRRCVFHYIEFPKDEALRQIVRSHFYPEAGDGGWPNPETEALVRLAVERFQWVREQLESGGATKLPSTSELLDWYNVLQRWHSTAEAHALLQEGEKLPYISVLLKNKDEQRRYGRPTTAQAAHEYNA